MLLEQSPYLVFVRKSLKVGIRIKIFGSISIGTPEGIAGELLKGVLENTTEIIFAWIARSILQGSPGNIAEGCGGRIPEEKQRTNSQKKKNPSYDLLKRFSKEFFRDIPKLFVKKHLLALRYAKPFTTVLPI